MKRKQINGKGIPFVSNTPLTKIKLVILALGNRPFSGAPSGENLLLRWTSYQTSLREKHSFYGTLVGKLQQKD